MAGPLGPAFFIGMADYLLARTEDAGVRLLADGTVRIGASTPVADIATNGLIAERFPALALAANAVVAAAASGSLGGNICQRPRCPYFLEGVACFKNGGAWCPAVAGENRELAVVDGGPCYIVHPSDVAVVLAALEARIEISSVGETRLLPITDFYVLPSERLDSETILAPGESVLAAHLSADSGGGVQFFEKRTATGGADFSLVSVAACKRPDGDVRIVLGGIAPRPWRVNTSVEEDVASGGLDEDAIATLADRALYDARPLSQNAYKVDMAAELLRGAIQVLG